VAPETLQTFSIRFEDSEFDETPYQQESFKVSRNETHCIYLSESGYRQLFPQVVWHARYPYLRTAPVPMFACLKRSETNNIKVVITGEGAMKCWQVDIFKEGIIREFWSRSPIQNTDLGFYKNYILSCSVPGQEQEHAQLFFGYELQDTSSPFYSHVLRWKNTSSNSKLFLRRLKIGYKWFWPAWGCQKDAPSRFDQYDRLSKSHGLNHQFLCRVTCCHPRAIVSEWPIQ